ncbi:hypothetical protein HZS_2235 [Henneguya salminicola]|nr:hypothetical protein HZS_2235 [Henneguya salminicola]
MLFLEELLFLKDEALETFYDWLAGLKNGQIETVMDISNVTLTSIGRNLCKLMSGGIIVEIDEAKLGKVKYHPGHRIYGAWIRG